MEFSLRSNGGKITATCGQGGAGLRIESGGDVLSIPISLLRGILDMADVAPVTQAAPISYAALAAATSSPAPAPPAPKRRGRPPKNAAAAQAATGGNAPAKLWSLARDYLDGKDVAVSLDELVDVATKNAWPFKGGARQSLIVTLRRHHDVFLHVGEHNYTLVGRTVPPIVAVAKAEPKRGPGRPRKIKPESSATDSTAPKKRGRPPKGSEPVVKGPQLWEFVRDWMKQNPGMRSLKELVAAGAEGAWPIKGEAARALPITIGRHADVFVNVDKKHFGLADDQAAAEAVAAQPPKKPGRPSKKEPKGALPSSARDPASVANRIEAWLKGNPGPHTADEIIAVADAEKWSGNRSARKAIAQALALFDDRFVVDADGRWGLVDTIG